MSAYDDLLDLAQRAARASGDLIRDRRPENLGVAIRGLNTRRDLNGQQGHLVGFNADTGRYLVRVRGDEVAVKPENTEPLIG